MKDYEKKETAVGIISGIFSAGLFVTLLFDVKWNFFVSLGIAAAVYAGITLIFRPVKKIGSVETDSIDGGDELLKRLETAQENSRSMERSMRRINDGEVRAEAENLHAVSEKIIGYLTENPDKIYAARQFIDYYQETAVKLISRYAGLEATGIFTDDIVRQRADSLAALRTLNNAFAKQYEKLLSGDMTDTDAEIRLLEKTVKMEGLK